MLDQILESLRRSSESPLQTQRELWKTWSRWWVQLTLDTLEKQRVALDASFKAGIEAIEQALRAAEAGNADEYRRRAEELWHRAFETLRSEYGNQLQDVKRWTETSFQMVRGQEKRS